MWMVELVDVNGGKLNAKQVQLTAANRSTGIDGVNATLIGAAGHYMGDVTFPVVGTWQILVEVVVDDFTIIRGDTELEIKR